MFERFVFAEDEMEFKYYVGQVKWGARFLGLTTVARDVVWATCSNQDFVDDLFVS